MSRLEIFLSLTEKKGWIVLDQLITVDRLRLIKKLGNIKIKETEEVKTVIKEMLVD
ncbi:MAG: type II toxin-antitoxin system PemK/MazF family toxin [Spirochaetaceae bacterium]|nr:type II toxin-antitoxin system PemK/MazF family toxin [Spirochaetaceae bacterium]